MKISLYAKLLPIYVGLGLLFVSPFYLAAYHRQQVQAVAAAAETKLATASHRAALRGLPTRIVIPGAGIDLPIVRGYYYDSQKTWSVSPTTANYATITHEANNEAGTTLIYGHALKYVLGRTAGLKVGDTAFIYTANQHIFKYVFTNSVIVDPTDTEIFDHLSGQPRLKLMTCGGSWSQNRRIMTFKLIGGV